MNPLFLTKEELIDLIGFKNKTKQIEFLRKRGTPFYLTKNNEPRVLRLLIEDHSNAEKIVLKKQWEPKVY